MAVPLCKKFDLEMLNTLKGYTGRIQNEPMGAESHRWTGTHNEYDISESLLSVEVTHMILIGGDLK